MHDWGWSWWRLGWTEVKLVNGSRLSSSPNELNASIKKHWWHISCKKCLRARNLWVNRSACDSTAESFFIDFFVIPKAFLFHIKLESVMMSQSRAPNWVMERDATCSELRAKPNVVNYTLCTSNNSFAMHFALKYHGKRVGGAAHVNKTDAHFEKRQTNCFNRHRRRRQRANLIKFSATLSTYFA